MNDFADFTVAQAEAQGFTHIETRCACGSIVCNPFRLLRAKHRVKSETKLADIVARATCSKCGARLETWRPWHQYIDGNPGLAGHSQ